MCYRLRKMNWSIFRLDHPTTLHDAAITRFSQWWKRYLRTGHGYAQGLLIHFRDGLSCCSKESLQIWFGAFIFPVTILILALPINIIILLLATACLVLFVWIALHFYKRLGNAKHSIICSVFNIIGKWPPTYRTSTFS